MQKHILNSKWTSVVPTSKEKHFIVIKVNYKDEKEIVIQNIILEAIITGQHYKMHPTELKNQEKWIKGWKS